MHIQFAQHQGLKDDLLQWKIQTKFIDQSKKIGNE